MVLKQNVIQILNIGVVQNMVFVEALQNTAIVIHASTIVPFPSKEKSDLIDDVVTIFHYLMAPHQNVLVLVLIIVAQSSVTVDLVQTIVNVQNALIIANRKLQETVSTYIIVNELSLLSTYSPVLFVNSLALFLKSIYRKYGKTRKNIVA